MGMVGHEIEQSGNTYNKDYILSAPWLFWLHGSHAALSIVKIQRDARTWTAHDRVPVIVDMPMWIA